MSAKFNNKKVAINALKDQRINSLKCWLRITLNGLWLVNDKRVDEWKLLLELVLTINDQQKLLFWLTLPNYGSGDTTSDFRGVLPFKVVH